MAQAKRWYAFALEIRVAARFLVGRLPHLGELAESIGLGFCSLFQRCRTCGLVLLIEFAALRLVQLLPALLVVPILFPAGHPVFAVSSRHTIRVIGISPILFVIGFAFNAAAMKLPILDQALA